VRPAKGNLKGEAYLEHSFGLQGSGNENNTIRKKSRRGVQAHKSRLSLLTAEVKYPGNDGMELDSCLAHLATWSCLPRSCDSSRQISTSAITCIKFSARQWPDRKDTDVRTAYPSRLLRVHDEHTDLDGLRRAES
jgi:hypothetical protein